MNSFARHATALAVSVACALSIGACSGSSKDETEATSNETVSEQVEVAEDQQDLRTIGSEEPGATELTLKSLLTSKVTELSCRKPGEEYGADLLLGTPLGADGAVTLRIPADWETFDLRMVTDGGTHELAAIPVRDIQDLELTQTEAGLSARIVTTSGIEMTVAETAPEPPAQEEPLEPQAAEQTEPEAVVTAEQGSSEYEQPQASESYAYTEPEPYYSEPVPEEPAYDYGYEAPMEAPQTTEQVEDSCIDDVVLKP